MYENLLGRTVGLRDEQLKAEVMWHCHCNVAGRRLCSSGPGAVSGPAVGHIVTAPGA